MATFDASSLRQLSESAKYRQAVSDDDRELAQERELLLLQDKYGRPRLPILLSHIQGECERAAKARSSQYEYEFCVHHQIDLEVTPQFVEKYTDWPILIPKAMLPNVAANAEPKEPYTKYGKELIDTLVSGGFVVKFIGARRGEARFPRDPLQFTRPAILISW